MNRTPNPNWTPDPQLLSAYFDGELEGRDDLADLRARIEAWLEGHPEADDEAAKNQQLSSLWQDTTPAEPSTAAWQHAAERIDADRQRRAAVARSHRPWLTAGIVTACIALVVGSAFSAFYAYQLVQNNDLTVKTPSPKLPDESEWEVLQVASAEDVTILRIEDADTPAIVVGTFPVAGPMEFAVTGEVCISCKCPRVVVRQDSPHPPMVYARLDTD